MTKDCRILAVVPARGGSKGIPNKNLISLGGRPLLSWTLDAARSAASIDRIILSSDSEEICQQGRELGFEVPFVRPASLARDNTPGIAPVLHALDTVEDSFHYVALLQPTSPLRLAEDIDAAVSLCRDGGAPACVSVTLCEPSPHWSFSVDSNGRLRRLLGDSGLPPRRQDLPPTYSLNGAVYVADVSWLRSAGGFLGPETVAHVMPRARSIDLDDELDLIVLEALLARRQSEPTE